MKEGDRNAKYFHVETAERRKMNMIKVIKAENRKECKSEEENAREIAKYFENLFTTINPEDCEEILEDIPRTITEAMNVNLTRAMEDQEIKKTFLSMHLHKAPGPNVYPFPFFKNTGMLLVKTFVMLLKLFSIPKTCWLFLIIS